MPKVSRYKMDKNLESAMFEQFWKSVSKINNSSEASQFFSDLLTSTEKIMLAKRFATAILLVREKSATEIKTSLHLTYTTIGTVASWVKNAKPKTKSILTNISKEKDWEKIIEKIDEILDSLQPLPRRDWIKVGKEKQKRSHQRIANQSLR